MMHQHGGVAAVVEDHVGRAAAMPVEQLGGVVPIFLQRFALDREHRNAGGRDCGGRVILRRIDVAGDPADVGAERGQRLDQHRGLDRHVQGAGNARALQRLLGAVFLTRRHQAGHFGFGQRDFLAAEFGERNILDDVIGEAGLGGGGGHVSFLLSSSSFRGASKRRTRNLEMVVMDSGFARYRERPGMTKKTHTARLSASARSVRSQEKLPSFSAARPKWP